MFRAPLPNAMRPFDHATIHYALTVDSTVTREDVMSQPFWANIVSRLKVGNLVDIFDPGGAVDVQVRVLSSANGIIRVRILRAYFDDEMSARAAGLVDDKPKLDLTEEDMNMFRVRDGGDAGYAIINKMTKEPVLKGIATKKQATAQCDRLNAEARAPVEA